MSGPNESAPPPGIHPDEMELAAWLDCTLAPGPRDGLEAHLSACHECRAGVALLRLGDEAAPIPSGMLRRARALEETPEVAARRPRRRLLLPAGLAAVFVAGGAVALWLGGRGGGAVPVERGGAAGVETIAPARGQAIAADRLAFSWQTMEGADRYVVTLLDAGGARVGVIEAGPSGGPLVWPSDRPPPPAGTYLWTVRALALDRVLAESRPVPFEIR